MAAPAVFPTVDPVGPADPGVDIRGREVIRDVVAPQAADADATGVRREVIDALAEAGLLGTPLEPRAAQRELAELLAGVDASTWFCWAQHQTPLRVLEGRVAGLRADAPEALRAELLPGLRSGRLLGAVAFAHVRRPGPPNPVATRVSDGWLLEGSLDWITSWDVADVVMVMAQGSGPDADSLVCSYLPAGHAGARTTGLVPGPPLDLLAMSGTHTRPARLDAVHVPDGRVGAVLDRETWLAADSVSTSDANPSAFGLARGAIADLSVLADERHDAGMAALCDALTQRCRLLRSRAYELVDGDGPESKRLAVRAASLDLAVTASTAVVTARAGAAMQLGRPPERRLREAMFLLVQAQTKATRDASLSLLRERAIADPDIQ